MYKPLPKQLTIKESPIEGLGLYAKEDIKKDSFIGVTHVRDEQFENKYIRTPIGGFYNHSNEPNVLRMVSDTLPKLEFGDNVNSKKKYSRRARRKRKPRRCFLSSTRKKRRKIYVFNNTQRY